MPDKVQRRTVVGVLRQLGHHLLHAVLAQHVDTGGDSLLAGGGVIHLAGAHQCNVRAGAPCLAGRLVDPAADLRNIFSDRHRSLPPCVFLIGCLSVIE